MYTFNDYLNVGKPSILLIGSPGVGKTILCSQLPKPIILECDNNIRGPVAFIQNLKKGGAPVKTDARFEIPHIKDGKVIPRSERYTRWGEIVAQAAADETCETIVTDSLTTWSDYIVDHIRAMQKKDIEGERGAKMDSQLTQPEWGALYGVTKNALVKLKTAGKRVVFTGHIETREDESQTTKNYLKYLAFPGSMREKMAALFDEVWLLEQTVSMTAKGKISRRVLRTMPSDFRESSLGLKTGSGLGHEFELDYEKLNALI